MAVPFRSPCPPEEISRRSASSKCEQRIVEEQDMNPHTPKLAPLINLHDIRVAAPCPADWNKMIGDERVRHCAECNLNVYNLSAMCEPEVQKLIVASQGRLCTRF